jgi:uncharacterized protein YfaS (alpha-2-macroglobulin family)
MPLEALGFLLPILSSYPSSREEVAAIRRHFGNRAEETAAAAHFTTTYKDGSHLILHSDRRADAIILEALIGDDPKNDLIPKIVRGLLAHRKQGRWSNTQENAFAVAALARYLAAAEAAEPDLVAHAWTGPRLAAEQPFRGRADGRFELAIPADSLGRPGTDLDLTLARTGAGRLYYRVALNYAIAGLVPAVARGFQVSRTYEAVDDSADVRRDDDGTWRVRLGARVRVRLTVGAAGPRYHVAIIDPLPAGFEAVNPSLAGTGGLSRPVLASGATHARMTLWPEHVNVRPDRFEAFRTLLDPGLRDITYFALATTAGDFAAPAPRAEEMYAPETFGRGAVERVIVGSVAPTVPRAR